MTPDSDGPAGLSQPVGYDIPVAAYLWRCTSQRQERAMHASDGHWTEGGVTALLANPVYTIRIHASLCGETQLHQSEDEWVARNVQLLEELSHERWVRTLLDILSDPGDPADIDELTYETAVLIAMNPAVAVNIPSAYATARRPRQYQRTCGCRPQFRSSTSSARTRTCTTSSPCSKVPTREEPKIHSATNTMTRRRPSDATNRAPAAAA